MPLKKILQFSALLNTFRQVERIIYVNGEGRMENDVEHSYHLAMLAWYLANTAHPDLDETLVLKYALVHDLVEAYAGDTYIYSDDEAHVKSKRDREHAAQEKLKETFSEFPELHHLIAAYEKRGDSESRFVYALDKIQPIINIYLDGGRTWKKKNITIEMLFSYKKDQVAVSPEIQKYFEEIMEILKIHENKLFNVT